MPSRSVEKRIVRPSGDQVPANSCVEGLGKRVRCPPPSAFTLLLEHSVTEGERLDSITAQYLGDPEQFWRVCDANGAVRPEELIETVGRKLRITLPEGIPGVV